MEAKRIFITGTGHAGRALLELILDSRLPGHTVCGVADSSGALANTAGMSRVELAGILEHKRRGLKFSRYKAIEAADFSADVPETILSVKPDLVAELSPSDTVSGGAAKVYAEAAIAAGADLVFASKGVLVCAWDAVFAAAKSAGTRIRYSATVGAGIPILDAGLAFSVANPVYGIDAVLNGTSVYILSLMEGGLSLDQALESAQKAGLAEADPSADLDGVDASAKLCILARTIMNKPLTMGDIARESLRSIKESDIALAKTKGMHIRAIGSVRLVDDTLTASVSLREVPSGSALARSGTENAVTFYSRHAGELTLMGKGAGPAETASAVARDMLILGQNR